MTAIPNCVHCGTCITAITRRHGKVAIVYGHPLLEGISKETYGVLIYQEQVMPAPHATTVPSLFKATV